MERLYTAIHDFRETGQFGDIAHGQTGLGDRARGAARRHQFDTGLRQPHRKLDQAGLVGYRKQSPLDLHPFGGRIILGNDSHVARPCRRPVQDRPFMCVRMARELAHRPGAANRQGRAFAKQMAAADGEALSRGPKRARRSSGSRRYRQAGRQSRSVCTRADPRDRRNVHRPRSAVARPRRRKTSSRHRRPS